jgi:hypothetical protein
VLFSFNLLSEFQRAIDPALKSYKQPAILRFEVFIFYLRRDSGSQRPSPGAAYVQKLGWLFATKAALHQPLTLASANFSEIRPTNRKCRMIFGSISEFRLNGDHRCSICTVEAEEKLHGK